MSAAVARGDSPECRRGPSRHCEGDRPRLGAEHTALDIKDYAETTMNELLGWYGYEKLDARGLHVPKPPSSSSSSPLRGDDSGPLSDSPPLSPSSPLRETETNPLDANGESITCGWCLKSGLKLFTLKTASGKTKAFCSEHCFNQCRRAAFKKNRVCNWCRHVRHTVNYVDFKDGDEQLQFCSDKCLNQYKMQIFCKETQAYLQLNPHLKDEAAKGALNSKLITPDLWLRDCGETNGGPVAARSEDGSESPDRRSHRDADIEDLTLASKPSSSSASTEELSRDRHESPEVISKDKAPVFCHEEVRSVLERRKRHHDSDPARKRHRGSGAKRCNAEAPPAHLSSSSQPSVPFQAHSRMFPSVFPQPLTHPPAAHTKTSQHRPNPLLHPLPPPPPILSNDFPSFTSPFFQPPLSPQQLDAVLRMQSNMRHPDSYVHNFPERIAPSSSFGQPNTMMLPYPIFVPLPVPIPIPLPLSSFLKASSASNERKDDQIYDKNRLDPDSSNQKIANGDDEASDLTVATRNERQGGSYAITNSDSHANKLTIIRNKNR